MRHRVFLECTSTHASRYNTGIQRAVRNLVTASMAVDGPWDCVPVVYNGRYLEPIAGLIGSIAASNDSGSKHTSVDRLRRSFHLARRGATQALPSANVRKILHSQRLEYGLRRMVYAVKNTRRWVRSFRSGGSRVEFRRGDTLVLLDSTWSVDLTAELRRARAAGADVWVVVNDLIPIEYPDLAPEGTPILIDKWLRRTVPRASGLLGISRSVADGLRAHLSRIGLTNSTSAAAVRIDWFYLGAGLDRIDAAPRLLVKIVAAFGRENVRTYIVVGTIEPRKNHARVLDAFEVLWSEGATVNLFIFGRLGWRSEELAQRIRSHPELGRRLQWFESATDAELEYAYQKAAALIFASDCEGFGLPLVEAMQYGLPVIASDIPIFREIGGDYPSYFDPHDPHDLPEVIRARESVIMSTPGRSIGRTPRQWMSWTDSARMLLEKVTSKDSARPAQVES